jgi:hypothetical protein
VILFAMVAALMGANASAQQPTAATLLNPNWCSDVPASPPPPYFDHHPGEWAETRQLCMSARKGDTGCAYACGDARERWSQQKAGRLDQPSIFPSPTDKPQGPFPLPGGASGYILPVQPAPANPNWCPGVPASPPPPRFETGPGGWASANKECSADRNKLSPRDFHDMMIECRNLCGYARGLW